MGPDHFVVSLLATSLSLVRGCWWWIQPHARLLACLFIYVLVACIANVFSKAFNYRGVRNSQKQERMQFCSENKWVKSGILSLPPLIAY